MPPVNLGQSLWRIVRGFWAQARRRDQLVFGAVARGLRPKRLLLVRHEQVPADADGRPHRKGNARELRSFLEQATVLSEAGVLDGHSARPGSRPAARDSNNAGGKASADFSPLHAVVEDAERLHIRRALGLTGGSVTKTAELLGINRKTLWEKMKKLAIENAGAPHNGRD